MKTVGLTYDLKTDYKFKEGDPVDANAEFDSPSTVDVIADAIAANGFKVKKIGNANNLLEKMDNLGVDIVFNISEGLTGRNRESQVPILLEMAGIPFVGADALTLVPRRFLWQRVFPLLSFLRQVPLTRWSIWIIANFP
jgi:D-alanine-D-alanine ligase